MANFNVHIGVAATVSLVASLVVYSTGVVTNLQAILLTVIGTLGGILPDIDSDNSTSIKVTFTILSTIISVITLFCILPTVGVLFSVLISLTLFLVSRFLLMTLCRHFTRHRGVIHSPAFGLLISLVVILVCSFIKTKLSVFVGIFVFLGFLIHLLLDEIYAIDLQGVTLKKSFGTAFTLFSLTNPMGYLIVYALLVLFIYFDYKIIEDVVQTLSMIKSHDIIGHLIPAHIFNSH